MRTVKLLACGLLGAISDPSLGAGDATRGASAFQACASCHSTTPNVQLTGPSLAHIWQQKGGSVPGFSRYSQAMKKTDIVWNDDTLNRWLANPSAVIPGTSITFPGLQDGGAREDVIAYLRAVSEGKGPASGQ